MKRLAVAFLSLALLAAPLAAEAQPGRTVLIGWLAPGPVPSDFDSFRQALSELGYVESRNLVIEQRYAGGRREQHPELAADLVRLKVDVIVTTGTRATRAAQAATTTIPIVSFTGNPVLSGLVPSFSRPGGNLTGFATLALELHETRIELLREAVPGIVRLTVLIDKSTSGRKSIRQSVEEAAQQWGIQSISVATVRRAEDLDGAFASAVKQGAGGILAVTSPLFIAERQRLVGLAAKTRLPAIYDRREFVQVGGLMSYGPRLPDMYRRAATYVDKILKGAKPADLPVEQPTKFELVINLKTAKALGLTIPQSVLLRADEIIE